jgi:diguanylate cyclase (GGDEF)-like protein/PAS domain S-box-containing protein
VAATVDPIRLLFAEDNPADVDLEMRELRRAGLAVTHRVTCTEKDFARELEEFAPEVILSDFSMPGFDGMQALRVAKERAAETPFIFVSGTLGEEYAIRAIRDGATDYVLKNNLIRLPAAIHRALEESKLKRARQSAEAGLARAQRMAVLAHVITGPGGNFESWSDSLVQLLGGQAGSVPQTTRQWLDLIHPEDRPEFRGRSLAAAATGKRVDVAYRLRRQDGEWIDIRQVIEPLSPEGLPGNSLRWFNTLQDVTEQKQAETNIRRLNRVYAVLSGINSLIVKARNRNELFRDACRVAVEHGKFPLAWIGMLNKDGQRLEIAASAGNGEGYLARMPLAAGTDSAQGEGLPGLAIRERSAVIANDIARDGRLKLRVEALARGFRALVLLPLVVRGEALGVMALYAEQAGFFDSQEMRLLNELAGDISFAIDHIEKAEKLEYLSYYDPLTGLANRMLLMDRLAQAAASTKAGEKLVLALLDIERFKSINDMFGRPEGDLLLAKMAARLVGLAGNANRVARVGADRFAVIVPQVRNEESIARIIDDGFARIEGEPFLVGGTELRIAIRSGVAIYPNDGADADSLFRNAEAALKKAKAGGDKYLFYTQQMTERFAERLSLENKLRQAIERQEFVLHYQPKVSLTDRSVVGVEALMRWQAPHGLVPPDEFIPLLEETGLIVQAGAWALRRAALDYRGWSEQGLRAPRIAVNVSPFQLRGNFVEMLKEALGDGGSPAGIDVEITESLIMEDLAGNIARLEAARELGVNIAIDDFGTGYSSLGYLAKLPVQSLKIDSSFIAAMEQDANAMTLVSTIISLAHSLRLKVVAEGVTAESQAQLLRLLNCDEMQGYLISKPLPLAAVTELLKGVAHGIDQ